MKTRMYLKYLRLNISCLLFIVLFTSNACQSRFNTELHYQPITSGEAFANLPSEWDSMELQVPQIGCSSCINLLIEKYLENQIQTKLGMIGVSRKKDLRLNYGQEFMDNPRIEISSGISYEIVARDCFERPALILHKSDTLYYFCFKTDEVNDVISYLSKHE